MIIRWPISWFVYQWCHFTTSRDSNVDYVHDVILFWILVYNDKTGSMIKECFYSVNEASLLSVHIRETKIVISFKNAKLVLIAVRKRSCEEGNVLTPVCQSFSPQGKGLPNPPTPGCRPSHRQTPWMLTPEADPSCAYPPDKSTSGQYTSYRNAFLLLNIFLHTSFYRQLRDMLCALTIHLKPFHNTCSCGYH